MGALGERINAGFSANAFSYLLFLRLVPLFPFFLVNLAPAFTTIRVRTYALATFIGIIPGAFVYVNLGRTLRASSPPRSWWAARRSSRWRSSACLR